MPRAALRSVMGALLPTQLLGQLDASPLRALGQRRANLMAAVERGISTLIDADMNEESTRLQALQVQQQLGIQALGCAAYAIWALVTCWIAWSIIGGLFGGIRVTEEEETMGLDIGEHGMEAYPDFASSGN